METEVSVTLTVASLNEETTIAGTLRSLRAGRVQPGLLVLVDSHSTDRTVERARPYVDVVLDAPRGKLTALDWAIHRVSGQLIAMADADTAYPPGWLAAHLAAWGPGVVLTHGPSHMDPFLLRPGYGLAEGVRRAYDVGVYRGRITSGRNRVVARAAYLHTPFNLAVRQQSFPIIWAEEEVLWPQRLRAHGSVLYVPEAWCHTSGRRADLGGAHWQQALRGERF